MNVTKHEPPRSWITFLLFLALAALAPFGLLYLRAELAPLPETAEVSPKHSEDYDNVIQSLRNLEQVYANQKKRGLVR